MKTLTSLIVGTSLLVASALAAQNGKDQKPATGSAPTSPSTSAQKTNHSKKTHRKHHKAVASNSAKPVPQQNAAPVSPVAPTKK